ncbi:MAG: hypothetical protein IJ831_01015, partial [Spirochaetales bacterium]|nr:hypothetical protein [Spirochaetales bacterium]
PRLFPEQAAVEVRLQLSGPMPEISSYSFSYTTDIVMIFGNLKTGNCEKLTLKKILLTFIFAEAFFPGRFVI